MADYAITILFDDQPDALVVDLAGIELEDAEAFTAQLRYDVAEAKSINAPVLTAIVPGGAGGPGTGGGLSLDPRHVRSIDLSERDRT